MNRHFVVGCNCCIGFKGCKGCRNWKKKLTISTITTFPTTTTSTQFLVKISFPLLLVKTISIFVAQDHEQSIKQQLVVA